MKKIIYISLIASAVLGGCKNSIDFVPQDKLSAGTFWKTQNDVQLALNGCYASLANAYNYAYDDGAADNAFCQYPWESSANRVSEGDIDATLDVGYNSRYVYIRRYNYFLDNVGKAVMDETLRKRFIAEVRVLRAFTYYELAHLFGPVPLLKNAYTDAEETAVAPTPVAEVIQFAIDEIKAAEADLLPSFASGAQDKSGRITNGAAWAILTRIQLEYGKYADAIVSAQKVKDAGYQLFRKTVLTGDDTKDDYSTLVTFTDNAAKEKFYKGLASYQQQFWIANEGNKEAILVSQNIQENEDYAPFGNGLRTLFAPPIMSGWGSITPLQTLVDAYWKSDGTTYTPPTPEQRAIDFNIKKTPSANYINEFKNRDTRLYASVLFPGATWNEYKDGYVFKWSGPGDGESFTGYNFKKYLDPVSLASGLVFDAPQDFSIIRYAEILLAYAEAKNELSGPDASIFAALDDIRDRAGMPPINQVVNNSKEKLREVIRNERRIELAGEGQRYFDIRRWKIAADVMKSPKDIANVIVQERIWDPKFMLMPFPQTALDRNTNLKDAQKAKGY
ncbi:RagB/SusD family nutrient uptake outer membrane protein [Sphingobacterium sp. UDSM-2020]|uniref:RagB/SusD family nutrient uptake outer membrane protein n=1 Tax=Sphingobacterium sp. UDSM-2020 TaxID=2795738 RepID=UPI001934E27C|nr:RagB/SusD family nutrient uptake outer membrane protein [Sphingobacterium sp. UDSM-2020]QQD13853.1 RagB/SusD family nutrient uptake outer membrane protein [Sphingobacterium sp. UDSM-2020]